MKVEYINPFYLATQDVFNRMLDVDIERGKLKVVEEMVAGREANVLIGMAGDLSGSVLYSFPKVMALEMVKILSGMEMEELDVFVTSALGEIANIISGNAAMYLEKANYICHIVPPQIIIGENKSISMATPQAIVLPLKTRIGEFEINISIKENRVQETNREGAE